MKLLRNKDTQENREFWSFVKKVAKEAKRGDWQKGAVTPWQPRIPEPSE